MVRASTVMVLALSLAACDYSADLNDCRVACSATASACPSGLSCDTSEGRCRTGETSATCAAIGGDAGPCLTYFDDEAAFAAATSSLSMNVEDFSRIANGSPTPNAFVIQGGDYFFWHERVTLATFGVNDMPGTRATTIAVGGNTAPTPSTIMSQLSSTARDAIVATFSRNVNAVAFRPSDDEGAQGYSFDVTTVSGTVSFPSASAHAPFVGVVSNCGSVITSTTLSPPMPSHWWRLFSVTFGP